jgi:hypothetical protein
MLLGVGGLTVWLLASEGLALAFAVLLVLAAVAVTLVCAVWPLRRPPTDVQLARFIEERAGGLDDVVVTAAQHAASSAAPAPSSPPGRPSRGCRCPNGSSAPSLRRAAIGTSQPRWSSWLRLRPRPLAAWGWPPTAPSRL